MTSWRAPIVLLMLAFTIILPSTGYSGPVAERVMKRELVRFGVPYNRVPQGFFNAGGELTGFEVDLATEMARHMNLKVELVKVNDKTWGPMLSADRIDAAFCRIRHTRSLDGQFDFSVPYFFDTLQIMVQKGRFKNAAELVGQKLAAVQGSSSEKEAMRLLKNAGDKSAEKNVASYPDRPACFMALGREKVAGWIDSGMNLLEYSSKTPGRFELIKATDVVEPVAVALPQDDSAWRDLVNLTIQDMAGDGSFKQIYDKWFGPDTSYAFPLVRPVEIWPE